MKTEVLVTENKERNEDEGLCKLGIKGRAEGSKAQGKDNMGVAVREGIREVRIYGV